MSATVKDVMSTHVIAVREIASFKGIATRLREQRVSAFPVIDDDNKVIGVVSEADLMMKPAVTIGPGEPVTNAARLMFDKRVKRLPVTDDDGRLNRGLLNRLRGSCTPKRGSGDAIAAPLRVGRDSHRFRTRAGAATSGATAIGP